MAPSLHNIHSQANSDLAVSKLVGCARQGRALSIGRGFWLVKQIGQAIATPAHFPHRQFERTFRGPECAHMVEVSHGV